MPDAVDFCSDDEAPAGLGELGCAGLGASGATDGDTGVGGEEAALGGDAGLDAGDTADGDTGVDGGEAALGGNACPVGDADLGGDACLVGDTVLGGD